jgi:hypothetical protein
MMIMMMTMMMTDDDDICDDDDDGEVMVLMAWRGDIIDDNGDVVMCGICRRMVVSCNIVWPE